MDAVQQASRPDTPRARVRRPAAGSRRGGPAAGGRQGRQPRRADPRRTAGARRLLRDHRGLPRGRATLPTSPRSSTSWPAPRRTTGPGRRAGRAGTRAGSCPRPCPRHVADAVTSAYRELGEPAVAVRSSATAEDLPFASFAGQQDTYLDDRRRGRRARRGPPLLGVAVDRPGGRPTAPRNGIDHAEVRLAVVVQRMVDAAVAGVLFTANPVTGTARGDRHRRQPRPRRGRGRGRGQPRPLRASTPRPATSLERRLGDKRLVVRAAPGRRHGSGRPAGDRTPPA